MSILDAALDYAARGWAVFPCEPRGKRPLTRSGFKDASTDPDVIRAWWRRWPNANVAIRTGPGSFDVLDIDGPEGERSLAELEARHDELPVGPRQITGRGRQLLFRGGSLLQSARRLPGIDTRGDGGYVVAAPSIHPTGAVYTFEDDDAPIPEPPAWLLAELRGEGMARELPPLGAPVEIGDETARLLLSMAGIALLRIPAGQRNDRLFRLGASLRARGQEHHALSSLLRLANIHLCEPPLDDEELRRIVDSAARLEVAAAYRRAEEVAERAADRAAQGFRDELRRERIDASAEAAREDRGAGLDAARELLRVPLRRVIQAGVAAPNYYLEIDDAEGETQLVRVTNLLAYADIKRKILDACGVVVSVRAKDWESAAVLLRSVAEPADPGLADEREATRHLLEAFLREKSPAVAETDEELRAARVIGSEVIRLGSELWFSFDSFSGWADRMGVRDGFQVLWRRLVEAGAVREAPRTFRYEGRIVNRRYWIASDPSDAPADSPVERADTRDIAASALYPRKR